MRPKTANDRGSADSVLSLVAVPDVTATCDSETTNDPRERANKMYGPHTLRDCGVPDGA